jgi:hypothetical protein
MFHRPLADKAGDEQILSGAAEIVLCPRQMPPLDQSLGSIFRIYYVDEREPTQLLSLVGYRGTPR